MSENVPPELENLDSKFQCIRPLTTIGNYLSKITVLQSTRRIIKSAYLARLKPSKCIRTRIYVFEFRNRTTCGYYVLSNRIKPLEGMVIAVEKFTVLQKIKCAFDGVIF